MKGILKVTQILINFFTIFLHSIGSYILRKLLPKARTKPQRMYLINLSVVEAVYNLLEMIRGVTDLLTTPGEHPWVDEMAQYVLTTNWTGVAFVFYLNMIYIPLDRLAFVALNIRYQSYWSAKKAKYHIAVTWFFGIMTSLTVCVFEKTRGFPWINVFFPYVYTTIDIVVVITSIISYILIFYFYRLSRSLSRDASMRTARPPRNRVPVALIGTYILLQLVPNVVYLLAIRTETELSTVVTTICNIAYGLSHLVDAVIYIFLLDNVRKYLIACLLCK